MAKNPLIDEPRISIKPEYKLEYASEDGERIKFQIGEIINRFSRYYREFTGKGALFKVYGQEPEPIRGEDVYERLLRRESIQELEEAARNRVNAETFRTTIETLLTGSLDEAKEE